MLRCIVCFLILFCIETIRCSRIRIQNNGYKDILVALPENAEEEERSRIVRSVEDMLVSSSVLLQMSTKGRAYFSQISFLIPDNWRIQENSQIWKSTSFNSTTFSDPRAILTEDKADVVITEDGQYPYVLHQDGCGRQAMRIILPKDFLLHRKEKGVEFLRLWSEYRYGVFPEGGFQNDEKYPAKYPSVDGKETKVTGCSDKTFWSSNLCNEDDEQCAENSLTSSLMDQHLHSSASFFCEGYVSLGPKHNAESPSKHNLLCKEEGTWFTVMRSPDFAHGKNAAPKYLQHATDVSFRFVQENISPRVIVAIEISSRMKRERKYILTQAAFYHFVYSTLPYGSEVILFVFGDEEGVKMVKQAMILKSEDSRILYVESQPLPEEASDIENISLSQLFDEIFLINEDTNNIKTVSPEIIIVTTESHLNASTYTKVKQKISETESRLHVMLFPESEKKTDEASLQDLCSETGGDFISLHTDSLGDLYRGFGKSIGSSNKEIQIMQDYLKEDDGIDLEVSFVVDEGLTENLKVYLFFPYLDVDHLQYRKTVLQTPSGSVLNFMKLDFLFAWVVDLTKPEVGEYVLKTRRIEDVTAPILISVTGRSTSEDSITVNVWAETLSEVEVSPRPVRIYAEVKQGWNPIKGAQVVASIHHPDGERSELTLFDDGLGDVDITKNDGIYARYFTNFTAPGYYNIYVKVFQASNITEIVKGPNDFCCGSIFTAVNTYSIGRFQREAGPFTFQLSKFEHSSRGDRYPPSRVTDLRLVDRFDRICILHWTAVGDDYDSGFAETYELKVFREKTIIRNRFSGSDQEIYSERIRSTPEATYGTTLNHAFELPSNMIGGVYYIAIRGIDDVGNVGEPSNSVPLWIKEPSAMVIDCEEQKQNCGKDKCEKSPVAEKLQGNGAKSIFSGVMTLVFIPANVFVPILSLIFSLIILNTL